MVSLDRLSPPKWHGFDVKSTEKLADFASRNTEARRELQEVERLAANSTEQISLWTNAIRQDAAQRVTLQQQLADAEAAHTLPTDDMLKQAIAESMALPFVLGVRIDSLGQLVYLMRLSSDYGDVGDVEIGLALRPTYRYNHVLKATLVRGGDDSFMFKRHSTGTEDNFRELHAAIALDRVDATSCLSQGQVSDLLRSVYRLLAGVDPGQHPVVDGSNEPVWSGVQCSDPVEALRKTVLQAYEIDSLVSRLKRELDRLDQDLFYCRERLKDCRSHLRDLRAKAANLHRQAELAEQNGVDHEVMAAQVAYIRSLPGVMGLRFDDDGLPVVHIRASHLLDGVRWDFGDYEIIFAPNQIYPSLGGLRAVKTRSTSSGLYDHFDNGVGAEGWFCFGNRSSDLKQLLAAQQYGELVHLIVNSLNTVNEYDNYFNVVDSRYHRIPTELVWQDRGRVGIKFHRSRRSTQQDIGATAVRGVNEWV